MLKQFTCKRCGGTYLILREGMFICQTCGCKYSVKEAKKPMIEGTTADGKRTVRLSKSSEADKVLMIADLEFETENYAKAFDLYSQVLKIDPDNARAVLYRAVASVWRSSIKDCHIDEINTSAVRAFPLMHDQVGDCRDYFIFAADALRDVTEVLNAVCKIYYDNYEKFHRKYILNAILTEEGPVYIDEKEEHKEKRIMEKGIWNCCVVSSCFPAFVLNSVSDYSESFDAFWNVMDKMIFNVEAYRRIANINHDFEVDKKREIIQRMKKRAKV